MYVVGVKVLLIEDDPVLAASLERVFQVEGIESCWVGDGLVGLQEARETACDVVVCDYALPRKDGLEIIRVLAGERPELPVILITAHGDADKAIEASRLGVRDVLMKPFEMEVLLERVREAGKMVTGAGKGTGVEQMPDRVLVGKSPAMLALYRQIGIAAATPGAVLILGETGTGKELVARAIYRHAVRADRPFVAVNCAAIPETLLESELFGHERGAFTGAVVRREGRFEQAGAGMIFLDEIGDMAPPTQAKLLRVLQERVYSRVGGSEELEVRCRIVAATQRDLETEVMAGRFRADLYYRLADVVLRVPPLRERRMDLPELAGQLLVRHCALMGVAVPALDEEAVQVLAAHDWPGNVRQLEMVLRGLAREARGGCLRGVDVRKALPSGNRARRGGVETLRDLAARELEEARQGGGGAYARLVAAAERELLGRAVELSGGNLAQAARWLGMTRSTLRGKLGTLGLGRGRGRE